MKKALALIVALITVTACACPALAEQARVMTSFYPIYLFALNVFDGIDEIAVDCMTAPETGCLHDYQLLVSDMMKLSEADALIICGAGMESYLPDVTAQFSSLTIVDCSQGIDLIAEDAEEGEYNAHTWLDVQNAIRIVQTIADECGALYPNINERLQRNATAYIKRLTLLDEAVREKLQPVVGKAIVTFHDAFPYFARAYGLRVAAVISEEHEETLTPWQLAQVIALVREADNPPLFTEPQYAAEAAFAVAAETGAKIYELDPLVTGEISLTAYETGMLQNADRLLAAFADAE